MTDTEKLRLAVAGETQQHRRLQCRRCNRTVSFADDLKSIYGWQFATDTGWLCPACQTPADHENFGTCPVDPRATRPD
jgi:rubrerythrin